MTHAELRIEYNVPLASLTSLKLGGAAECFVRARSEADLLASIEYAKRQEAPLTILAGGSNVVISDAGIAGLVVHLNTKGVVFENDGDRVLAKVAAGENWNDFVEAAVARNLAGVECLGGIPGSVGATPIQNVGAYGQEVSDSIVSVTVIERATGKRHRILNKDCHFAYRDSRFKSSPEEFIVSSVEFELIPDGAPALRYGDLTRRLSELSAQPTLQQTRTQVIALRRAKSMVIDPADENHRSAGSFFTNPIVPRELADEAIRRALSKRIITEAAQVPQYPAKEGLVKLAAGWLIEKSGTQKGTRSVNVGISTKHALALVHHGGGTTRELLAFADRVAKKVHVEFGIRLEREPRFLGRA